MVVLNFPDNSQLIRLDAFSAQMTEFQVEIFSEKGKILSIKKKLILISLVFSIFIILLMGVNFFIMDTLSTVRAYVGGEAFWSKGQKDAIYYLLKYTNTSEENEFIRYQESLIVPLGDKVARLELNKENSDLNIVTNGFIQGKNHPDDVLSMALLYKRFHWISYLKKTIYYWEQGDAEIVNLQTLASEIRSHALKKEITPALRLDYIVRIEELNQKLNFYEAQYSYSLGEAARWLTSMLRLLSFGTAFACLFFAIWISYRVGKSILKTIEMLKEATIRVEKGDLITPINITPNGDSFRNSKDELVLLASSFNKMTSSLAHAIDERNLALEKLEIRANQLSEAQELAHIGNWDWDLSSNDVQASLEFSRIFDLDPNKPISFDSAFAKVHPIDKEIVEQAIANSLEQQIEFHLDFQIVIKNGEIREVSAHGKPVFDQSGNMIKLTGYTQDITERFVIQTQMIHSSKMASLGEMASGIAHEINNPLTIIKLATAQLHKNIVDDPNSSPGSVNLLMRIGSTVDRITKIIQGLRVFSRDGRNDPYEVVNVESMVEDILSFCNERLKHHSIKLIKENITPELFFEGRKTEISQVILNLLNNAFDATDESREKWIKISTKTNHEFFEIRVTDSGHGIPEEMQTKIFQPFFTSKDIGKGTGLGLSLSTTIVKNHRGELFLDKECKNTSFVVRLPKIQTKKH